MKIKSRCNSLLLDNEFIGLNVLDSIDEYFRVKFQEVSENLIYILIAT